MSGRGFFITATGTDAGKTVLTALMGRQLRAQGEAVALLKPVSSGFDEEAPEASDAGKLLAALGREIAPKALDAIAPWRFAAPLSPHLAAAREGREIDFEALVAWSRASMLPEGVTLIEGAGGVMSPLTSRHTMRDWMSALGLPVILVAGTYLGNLSHTLASVEALRAADVRIHAVVVNVADAQEKEAFDTLTTLRGFLGEGLPIHTLAHIADWRSASDMLGVLA